MGSLDLEAHRLQNHNDVPTALFTAIHRREIEVPAYVMSLDERVPLLVAVEKEELRLRTYHHSVAHLLRYLDHSPQGQTWTSFEGCTVGSVDVTYQARDPRPIRAHPRIDPERIEIGNEQHVRLLDPHESLDRRAVEQDLAIEGLLELAPRHLHIFQCPHQVGELKSQEPYFLAVHGFEYLGATWQSVPPFVVRKT
jgi:hypothetical protein